MDGEEKPEKSFAHLFPIFNLNSLPVEKTFWCLCRTFVSQYYKLHHGLLAQLLRLYHEREVAARVDSQQ